MSGPETAPAPAPKVTERPWLDGLPFSVDRREFAASAAGLEGDGACCVFVVDRSIPRRARGGYACLVIAYSRAAEPVTIFEDGSAALLIGDGGAASARIAAERVIHQAARLGLEWTLRAGIDSLGARGVEESVERARQAAQDAAPGTVADAA